MWYNQYIGNFESEGRMKMITVGEYVVYGAAGVCKVAAFEEKSFDGVHKTEYCTLKPVFSGNSVYYVPTAALEQKVRTLISRDDVNGIIRRIPQIDRLRIDNFRQKREVFCSILKSGDYDKLVSMIKLLHFEKQERSASGKKINLADEKAMHDAEELMNQEFSIVLDIDKSEVPKYIESTIAGA